MDRPLGDWVGMPREMRHNQQAEETTSRLHLHPALSLKLPPWFKDNVNSSVQLRPVLFSFPSFPPLLFFFFPFSFFLFFLFFWFSLCFKPFPQRTQVSQICGVSGSQHLTSGLAFLTSISLHSTLRHICLAHVPSLLFPSIYISLLYFSNQSNAAHWPSFAFLPVNSHSN